MFHGAWYQIGAQVRGFGSFPSHRLSHFNLHYKGERVSLVFHTDAAGLQWALTRNNWGGSKYIKQGIV